MRRARRAAPRRRRVCRRNAPSLPHPPGFLPLLANAARDAAWGSQGGGGSNGRPGSDLSNRWVVHYWMGARCGVDKAGAAAALAVQLKALIETEEQASPPSFCDIHVCLTLSPSGPFVTLAFFLHIYSSAYIGIRCIPVYTGIHRYTPVYTGIHRYTPVYTLGILRHLLFLGSHAS